MWTPQWTHCTTGFTHYGPSAGLPELRKAIADEVGATRHTRVSPDEVVVVPGGKPIIFFTMLALVEEGDEVIYPNPGFPIYESMIEFLGAKAVPIQLREEMEFRLDTRELKRLINAAHQAHHSQLAAEPYRRRDDPQDIEEIADIVAGQRRHGAER